MDAALLNLLLTAGLAILTFAFRKRILTALGRLLFTKSVEFVRATYFEDVEVETEKGEKRRLTRLRPAGEALLASVMPSLIASAVKSLKFKAPPGGLLPPGIDIGSMDVGALLQLAPKKYQGPIAAGITIARALGIDLTNLGKKGGGKPSGKELENPFLKEPG